MKNIKKQSKPSKDRTVNDRSIIYRKIGINITIFMIIFIVVLMPILLWFVPKKMQETVLIALFIIEVENFLLFCSLFINTFIVKTLSYISSLFVGIIGISLFFTNSTLTGIVSILCIILLPTCFLAAPLLIIYLGIKSIREKESALKNSYGGSTIVTGADAVGAGVMYIVIGYIFLSLVLAALMWGVCGPNKNGLCIVSEYTDFNFTLASSILWPIPILSMAFISIGSAFLYTLYANWRNSKQKI